MEDQASKKRVRVDANDSDSDSDSLEVKRLRDGLLDLLDDSDPDPADLDSVMKSFAEEISPVSSPPMPATGVAESLPELGYLLFASDDELGLPPSDVSTSQDEKEEEAGVGEPVGASSESSGIDEIWRFEDPIPSYDSFELGGEGVRYYNDTEYEAYDGLFEHSDVYSVFS